MKKPFQYVAMFFIQSPAQGEQTGERKARGVSWAGRKIFESERIFFIVGESRHRMCDERELYARGESGRARAKNGESGMRVREIVREIGGMKCQWGETVHESSSFSKRNQSETISIVVVSVSELPT